MIMRLRTLASIARPRPLIFGLALGIFSALPSAARAQDPGGLTPDELAVPAASAESDAVDPAEAGDLELSDPAVQALQDTLKDLGYFYGPSDGRKGPRTRTALRNFQRDQGLAVTGSIDQATLDRLEDQARLARTEHQPDAAAVEMPSPPPSPSRARRAGGALASVGGAVVGGTKAGIGAVGTAGKSTVGAVGTAGKATGSAVGTAGQAVGTAGKATGTATATAGKATAKGAVVTADATATAAKAVANATVAVYSTSKRLIVGDGKGDSERSDEAIRTSIERQYAEEDRIVPGEVEVRVSKGNVTLVLPEGARSDVPHAVRLAKLTPGVRSVTSVTTSVTESPGATATPDPARAVPPPPEPVPAEPASVDPAVDPAPTSEEPVLRPQ
jgi:osmotically-inducible protein OsmY